MDVVLALIDAAASVADAQANVLHALAEATAPGSPAMVLTAGRDSRKALFAALQRLKHRLNPCSTDAVAVECIARHDAGATSAERQAAAMAYVARPPPFAATQLCGASSCLTEYCVTLVFPIEL
jgi:hypothetical protein